MRGYVSVVLSNLFVEFHSQLSCSCNVPMRATMLLRPVKGINRGAAWREPRLCGINRPFFDCPYPNPDVRRIQLLPTIVWRPIQGKIHGWDWKETPDLDGLMVPLGGYREIATRWTNFKVFPDNRCIVFVHQIARPREGRAGTAIHVSGERTGEPTYFRAVNEQRVERSRLVVRVKTLRYYDLKLWFLADKHGQVSKRRTEDVVTALERAKRIFEVQTNLPFRNFNELSNTRPVPQSIAQGLKSKPVGNALDLRSCSRHTARAFHASDETSGNVEIAIVDLPCGDV